MRQPCDVRNLLEEHHTHVRVGDAQLSHEVHSTIAEFPGLAWPRDLRGGRRTRVEERTSRDRISTAADDPPPHVAPLTTAISHGRSSSNPKSSKSLIFYRRFCPDRRSDAPFRPWRQRHGAIKFRKTRILTQLNRTSDLAKPDSTCIPSCNSTSIPRHLHTHLAVRATALPALFQLGCQRAA